MSSVPGSGGGRSPSNVPAEDESVRGNSMTASPDESFENEQEASNMDDDAMSDGLGGGEDAGVEEEKRDNQEVGVVARVADDAAESSPSLVAAANPPMEPADEDRIEVEVSSTPQKEEAVDMAREFSVASSSGDPTCAVCLDTLKKEEVAQDGAPPTPRAAPSIVLSCTHIFHRECISEWFMTRHNTCPVCRANVTREQMLEFGIDVPERKAEYDAFFIADEDMRGIEDGLEAVQNAVNPKMTELDNVLYSIMLFVILIGSLGLLIVAGETRICGSRWVDGENYDCCSICDNDEIFIDPTDEQCLVTGSMYSDTLDGALNVTKVFRWAVFPAVAIYMLVQRLGSRRFLGWTCYERMCICKNPNRAHIQSVLSIVLLVFTALESAIGLVRYLSLQEKDPLVTCPAADEEHSHCEAIFDTATNNAVCESRLFLGTYMVSAILCAVSVASTYILNCMNARAQQPGQGQPVANEVRMEVIAVGPM